MRKGGIHHIYEIKKIEKSKGAICNKPAGINRSIADGGSKEGGKFVNH